jgi:hypothetical protein
MGTYGSRIGYRKDKNRASPNKLTSVPVEVAAEFLTALLYTRGNMPQGHPIGETMTETQLQRLLELMERTTIALEKIARIMEEKEAR